MVGKHIAFKQGPLAESNSIVCPSQPKLPFLLNTENSSKSQFQEMEKENS